jgi:hypothetical protein
MLVSLGLADRDILSGVRFWDSFVVSNFEISLSDLECCVLVGARTGARVQRPIPNPSDAEPLGR